jgi:hypothetical protein
VRAFNRAILEFVALGSAQAVKPKIVHLMTPHVTGPNAAHREYEPVRRLDAHALPVLPL